MSSSVSRVFFSFFFFERGVGGNGICASTVSGTFPATTQQEIRRVSSLQDQQPGQGSSEHVSMRDVNCKVSNVLLR